MKHQWLAYVIVGLLSIGAGVAIAGPPDNVPVDATIIPTTTTEAPEVTVPATTVAPTTVPLTTGRDDPTVAEPPSRDHRARRFARRTARPWRPGRGCRQRRQRGRRGPRAWPTNSTLGYVDVLPLNGSDIVEFTVIDYSDGFEEAALRLADDLAVLPEFVAPLDEAPAVDDLSENIELVVYIGRDRA